MQEIIHFPFFSLFFLHNNFSSPISFWFSCFVFGRVFWLVADYCFGCNQTFRLQFGAPLDTEMCLCRELLTLHWRIWLSFPAKPHHGRFVRSLIVSNSFCWLRTCPGRIRDPLKSQTQQVSLKTSMMVLSCKEACAVAETDHEWATFSNYPLYFFVLLCHCRMEEKYPNMSYTNKIAAVKCQCQNLFFGFNGHINIFINIPLVSFFLNHYTDC